MSDKRIYLKRSKCYAYVKLVSGNQASLYIPGKLDTFLNRNDDGQWYIGKDVLLHANNKLGWGQTIDMADIYTGKNCVESIINNELFHLVNEVMFDESIRDTVSKV